MTAFSLLPFPPHFLRRIGLVVFWLWKGNHRTAGAWIFQMTNVAHAYFWHIWLPQGNKTLLMQGDHLLSVAGVSEQAGSVCTHTHSLARAHRHNTCARRQTDRHILTQRGGWGAHRQPDTCAHTCTNSRIHWEHAQQTGSKLLYKSNTPFFFFFFYFGVFVKCAVNLTLEGDRECTHFLC